MNDRMILEQRLATLDSLLDSTGHLLGPAGAALGERLRTSWEAERLLLRRLLVETPADDVRATIAVWRARTAAYLERAQDENAAWTDHSGQRWQAAGVLAVLDETTERLDTWMTAAEPLTDDEES
jgi:hypothetical protein